MDLKAILDAIPEHIEKLTIKHVNQCRLRDNLCISVRRDNSLCTALNKRKVPFLHRKHVYHVCEVH